MTQQQIIETSGEATVIAGVKLSLGKARATQIAATFRPLVERANEAVCKYSGVSVTKEDDVAGMKVARTARLALRAIRLEIEEAHSAEKESAKIEGRCIDEIKRNALELIRPEEERLQACEDFAKNAEAARKAALRAERSAALAQVEAITTGFVLEDLPEDRWLELLESETAKFNARKAAAAQAELDRQARAKDDAETERKLRIENDRLRAEQAAKDRAAAAEKAKADEWARKQRAEREAELREQQEALRLEREAREEAERIVRERERAEADRVAAAERERIAAEAAPEADKLRAYAQALLAVPLPAMESDRGREAADWIARNLGTFTNRINGKAIELTEGVGLTRGGA